MQDHVAIRMSSTDLEGFSASLVPRLKSLCVIGGGRSGTFLPTPLKLLLSTSFTADPLLPCIVGCALWTSRWVGPLLPPCSSRITRSWRVNTDNRTLVEFFAGLSMDGKNVIDGGLGGGGWRDTTGSVSILNFLSGRRWRAAGLGGRNGRLGLLGRGGVWVLCGPVRGTLDSDPLEVLSRLTWRANLVLFAFLFSGKILWVSTLSCSKEVLVCFSFSPCASAMLLRTIGTLFWVFSGDFILLGRISGEAPVETITEGGGGVTMTCWVIFSSTWSALSLPECGENGRSEGFGELCLGERTGECMRGRYDKHGNTRL